MKKEKEKEETNPLFCLSKCFYGQAPQVTQQ